jgi:hypothetical protein
MSAKTSDTLVSHSPIPYAFCSPPKSEVVHIGSHSHLWSVKPWNLVGTDQTFGGRFDDPGGAKIPPIKQADRFHVLYCADEFTGALCEVVGHEKPSPKALLASRNKAPQQGYIDAAWYQHRTAGYTILATDQIYVDLTASTTINALMQNRELIRLIRRLNLTGLDRGDLLGQKRVVTQTIARIIYEKTTPPATLPGQPAGSGVAGLHFESRHPSRWSCWALYSERVHHTPVRNQNFTSKDIEVLRALDELGLLVEVAPGEYKSPAELL